ncbi:MAG: hypothetical protein ACR2GD_11120 [Pyrinomonadaceae bacterium]
MKFLVILFILLMILMLLALRYRRQIQTGLQVWRMFRQVRRASKPKQTEPISKRKIEKNESLVNCARCGKWVAPSDALNLRSSTVYCSTNCMEKAARLESLVDKN